MKPHVRQKINSIIYEINAITRELDEISNGLNHEFKGIGSVKSASSLQNAADQYRRVGHNLRRI
ncbi:hypothetical protein [Ferdinandcohnia sp. Marseille-Q9671]